MTLVVLFGIGKIENVFNALITGFVITKECVSLSQINAKPSISLETVDLAMMDTTWLVENVNSLPSKSQKMLVVLFGTGKIKTVLNALTIGCSMVKECVSRCQTSVKPLISLEIVDLAMTDTT